jgi:hypothetical protein
VLPVKIGNLKLFQLINSNLTQKILSKSKYRNLLPSVVETAVIEASKKYRPKEIESEASKLLHQTFGAFGGFGLNYQKYID